MQSINQTSAASEPKPRMVGYDVARAFAVLGMVMVNFKIVMGASENGPEWLVWLVSLLEGRAAATFVVLAGVGLSLLSRRALTANDHTGLTRCRNMLLKRALFLFIVGLLYTPLWPADILHFYGVYIAVCAFLLSTSNRRLWAVAAIFLIGFVVMLFTLDYERGWNWETLDYAGFWTLPGMIRHLFFNGFHPVFPWTAFMVLGMWLGRHDMSNRRFRNRLLALSVLTVTLTELASTGCIWILSGGTSEHEAEIITSLFETSPMPPMPFYLLSAGGTAFVAITLCIILTEKFPTATWIKPFISTGQLALTNYVAHVVIGMGCLGLLGLLDDQPLLVAVGSALTFFVGAVVFSHLWRHNFSRGPLEWVMRKITA